MRYLMIASQFSKSFSALLPLLGMCVMVFSANAQMAPPAPVSPAVEPPYLIERRAAFEKAAARETVSLNDLFEPHLAALEASSGAAGDYASALAAQQRRQALAAGSKELRELLAGETGTALAFTDAKLSGGVALENGSLGGWRSGVVGAAEWSVSLLQLGKYEVEVEYRLVADGPKAITPSAPRFKFREVSKLTGASGNYVNLVLQPADLPLVVRAQGSVALTHVPADFRLEAEAIYSGQTLEVKSVKLIPVSEPPVGTAAAAASSITPTVDGKAELDALKQKHIERLRAAREPVVRDYLEMLASLGQKGAGERVVAAETKRAKKLLEPGSGKDGPGNYGGGKTGFTSLTDVKYVSDDANTGDRFKVEHEGQTFWVRLMWTTCPPMDAKSGQAMRLVRDRFKIDELSAVALGQTAREFTELYLAGHPLKLLAKATPAADGSLVALVYVEPVGLFQHVLVDHGLAVVDAPSGSNKRPALEAGLLAAMEEREKRAKEAIPPEGGWGYGQ